MQRKNGRSGLQEVARSASLPETERPPQTGTAQDTGWQRVSAQGSLLMGAGPPSGPRGYRRSIIRLQGCGVVTVDEDIPARMKNMLGINSPADDVALPNGFSLLVLYIISP